MNQQTTKEMEQQFRDHLDILCIAASTIKKEGYRFGNPSLMLREIGEVMGGKDVDPDTDLVELVARTEHHEIKQCYLNCAQLAIYADWVYCEGYVLRKDLPFPVMHAWLELDGFVYDPTLRELGTEEEGDLGSRLANNNERNFYYGVRLDKDVVHAEMIRRGCSFSVLQDYELCWPVLKENSPWLK